MSIELGPYELRLLTVAGTYVLLVIGYQFVFGHAGALSLAQGAFFGLGAYATGLLATRLGWEFFATFPLSILLPAALAALVAAPVLRLESHYFALATLGVAQVVLLAAVNWTELTGGANGIPGVPGIVVFGTPVPRGWPLLLTVWSLVALGAVAAFAALRGRPRLVFPVLRENPIAAASLGIDAGRLRLLAFVASAAYAGAGGALYVHTLRVVSPEALGFPIMVACLAMTLIGGRTQLAGAFIGALLLVHLPEWFRFLDLYRNVAYGAALLLVVVAAPGGIAGTLARLFPRRAATVRPTPLPPRRASSALVVENLTKSFGGVRALDGVGLAVRPGEVLGLIGPNGSGKTTLVNIVSGLYPPDAGTVRLGAGELTGLAAHEVARKGVARTFQNLALVDEVAVLDTVAVARDGRPGKARGEALFLLERLGLAEAAAKPVGALPPAQRRRVELARALALDPLVLLLDEPAAGLSAAEQADLAARLREVAAAGVALLVVEHNMPFLLPLANRVVCLDAGRVIAEGVPEEVRRHRAVVEAYLGAAA